MNNIRVFYYEEKIIELVAYSILDSRFEHSKELHIMNYNELMHKNYKNIKNILRKITLE